MEVRDEELLERMKKSIEQIAGDDLSRDCVKFCILLLGTHSASILEDFNAKLKCVDSIPESSIKLIVKTLDCLKSNTKQSLAIYTTLESISTDFSPFIPGLIACFIKTGAD